jgi:hypothetical protein
MRHGLRATPDVQQAMTSPERLNMRLSPQVREQSLLEQHQLAVEKQRKAAKKQKVASRAAEGKPDGAAEKGQTWTPFDRNKDLQGPTDNKSRYQSMLDGDSSLGLRFHPDR